MTRRGEKWSSDRCLIADKSRFLNSSRFYCFSSEFIIGRGERGESCTEPERIRSASQVVILSIHSHFSANQINTSIPGLFWPVSQSVRVRDCSCELHFILIHSQTHSNRTKRTPWNELSLTEWAPLNWIIGNDLRTNDCNHVMVTYYSLGCECNDETRYYQSGLVNLRINCKRIGLNCQTLFCRRNVEFLRGLVS